MQFFKTDRVDNSFYRCIYLPIYMNVLGELYTVDNFGNLAIVLSHDIEHFVEQEH